MARRSGAPNKRKPVGWIPPGVTVKKYSWLVLDQRFDYNKHMLFYYVRCDCGFERWLNAYSVNNGVSRKCKQCALNDFIENSKITRFVA